MTDEFPTPSAQSRLESGGFWTAQLARIGTGFHLAEALLIEEDAQGPRAHSLTLSPQCRELCRQIGKQTVRGELVVLLAAIVALLRRYSDRDTVTVETPPLAGPDLPAGDALLVPLVFEIDEASSLRGLLLAVRKTITESYSQQALLALTPAYTGSGYSDVLVRHESAHHGLADASHPFAFVIGPETLRLEDRLGILSPRFVASLRQHLDNIVAQFAMLDAPLSGLRILSVVEEVALRDELNKTDDPAYVSAPPISRAFSDCVQLHEDRAAVITGPIILTYRELNRRANQLAHHLIRDLGLRAGQTVAVMCDRSEHAIVALLAVLKAGGVYLPLSAEHPVPRLRSMIEAAEARVLVIHSLFLEFLTELGPLPAVCIDLQASTLSTPDTDPDIGTVSTDLAAIIFTSGSTGQPKGVPIEQRGLMNVALDHIAELSVGVDDRYLQFMSLSFDGSLLDILTGILSGAALVMVSEEIMRDVAAFEDYLEEKGVTVFTVTPSYLRLLNPARLAGVRAIISAAEPANVADAERYSRTHRFYNGYGPSEVCVNATLHLAEAGRRYRSVPIGRPRANKQVYVLDRRQRLLPFGTCGEIGLSGCGLTSGYLGDAELTGKKFVPHPFLSRERLYLSGDLGAWSEAGELYFKGRRDRQIKLRGFRVELDEIEQALLRHPDVRHAAVLLDANRSRLVAFVVMRRPGSEAALTSHMRMQLPSFMIPSAIHALSALPQTPNGKVDRQALLQQATVLVPAPAAEPPGDPVEKALLEVWQEVLGHPEISTVADFFELGGDSIRIVQAVVLAKERGIEINTHELIAHRTVRKLAAHVRAKDRLAVDQRRVDAAALAALEVSPTERLEIEGPFVDVYPVSGMQELMLRKYLEPANRRNGVYHCIASWHLEDSSFSLPALEQAVTRLQQRHRSLRTDCFWSRSSGRYLQVIRPAGERLKIIDMRARSASAQATGIEELITTDIENGYVPNHPFVRFYAVLRSETSFQLILSAHHAVIDGWSAVELENELFGMYLAIKTGHTPAAATPESDTYKEFVALEQQVWRSAAHAQFFRTALGAAVDARLPERPGPRQTDSFGRLSATLSSTAAALLQQSARDGITLKAACLYTFLAALHSWSGQEQLTVGLVANGRSAQLSDPLGTTGLFWNLVPFASRLGGGDTGLDVRTIQARLHELEPYAGYPLLAMLADARREEPFDVCFNFTNFHREQKSPAGIRVLEFDGHDRFHHPLTFIVQVAPQRSEFQIDVRLEYRRPYLDDAEAARLLDGFVALTQTTARLTT